MPRSTATAYGLTGAKTASRHIQASTILRFIWHEYGIYGHAEITVDNRTGPAPTVYYAPPHLNFLRGAIGLEPVKRPDWLLYPIIMVLLFSIPVTAFVIGVVRDASHK